jgi:hypothetical protein
MRMLLLGPRAAFAEEEEPPEPGATGGGRLIGPNRMARTITDRVGVLPWPEGPWGAWLDET